MKRKIVTMLVIMSLFGFSTAFAHDPEENDQAAGTVLFAGLALVTAAILIASHDSHGAYQPAPRHVPDRRHEYRGGEYPRHHDGGGSDAYRGHDGRRTDSGQQGEGWGDRH